MSRRAAAFLDRDGVLNLDDGYTFRPEALRFVSGAQDAVRRLNDLGFWVVVVTNQSGIARGLYTEDDMDLFHAHMQAHLAEAGAHLDAIYACPFHPDAVVEKYRGDHPDRKPRPGMILRAFEELDADRERSFLIGDRPTDIQAAQAAGIPGYSFVGPNLDDFVVAVLAAEGRRLRG